MFAFLHTKSPQPEVPDKILESSLSAEKLRTTLLLVFGGLLSLMLVASVEALLSLRQLHTIEEQVSGRFMTRTQALSTVLISVHVYDDQLERFLLEDQPIEQSQVGIEIASHSAEAHSALRSYPPDREPQEQKMLNEIEQELSEQEVTFAALLSRAPGDRREHSRQFIHEQLIPRSLDILQVSQQIALLNSGRLAQENQALLTRFQGLQMKLRSMLILALAAGFLLSIVGSFYILRLERQGRQRYRVLADNRRELEKLSARLLDVQEQERRSISRELHDEVGQSLEALLVDLGRLSTLVSPADQAIREQITRVKSLAENSVKTVRDIALLLRPSMLDDLGLIPALEWQAREISRRSDMEVEVHSEMVSEKLPDETKICVYRLVQEALNNAATHAAAKNARVSVVQTPEKLRVEIIDDGLGFDSRRVRGMGLLGMEERVKRLGGTLSIESRAGQGTSLKAELPLDPAKSS